MTDREPTQIREYIPEHNKKSADDMRRDIELIKLAYKRGDNDGPCVWLGWFLLMLILSVPVGAIVIYILF